MKTVMTLVDEYVKTVNGGIARWSHRPQTKWSLGGHADRIIHGANRKLRKQLATLGYTEKKHIDQVVKDAWDLAELQRLATEDE